MNEGEDGHEVVAAERRGWQALSEGRGGEHYRRELTEDAVMAFSFGVLERDQAVAAMASAMPWSKFELEEVRVVPLSNDSAVLVYRVRAQRGDQDTYEALVSSVFARRDGSWRLAFHQQTETA